MSEIVSVNKALIQISCAELLSLLFFPSVVCFNSAELLCLSIPSFRRISSNLMPTFALPAPAIWADSKPANYPNFRRMRQPAGKGGFPALPSSVWQQQWQVVGVHIL